MYTPKVLLAIRFQMLAALCTLSAPAEAAESQKMVAYRVELVDPVTPAEPPRVYRVVQTRDENGFPTGYQMSFETPVCIDEQCRIVQCTMYWNALGYYERLEYPAEMPLTKKKHEPFHAEDYVRLDQILKDRDSVLGAISLESLVGPAPDEATSEDPPLPQDAAADDLGVDGWSGATPLTVKQAVVDDAAYTSWAMWRWANGDIVPKLLALTRPSCTPDYLRHLLRSEDRRDVDFALKYASDRYGDDPQFADDVFHVLEAADREHVTLALRYLDRAMQGRRPQLHARLIDACRRMKDNHSPLVLDYFASAPELPPETLEGLTTILDRLSYFQIHLILRLLDQKGFSSRQAESNIAGLLDSENFFIARRAYEHLTKQDPSAEAAERLQVFRQQHQDRL